MLGKVFDRFVEKSPLSVMASIYGRCYEGQ